MIELVDKPILPIVDFEDSFDGRTDTLHKNVIPLCPHCKEWSYYTTASANSMNGVHICPFCNGHMYMPEEAVQCDTCGCGTLNHADEDEAAYSWNRRDENGGDNNTTTI